ncbi:Polyisoprenoid-binding protein YceI [Halopseudomonas xinjiangensis]|uniref:Polyisoprenoid-binding protein YceI n=1 Tax=Halopseudomonas xinjiangensis TaxID=487184 RepID=A0A1H1L2X2_9GAMM|nr:YceI family protein [Halopseudomonas xinjiangensis]SDR68931.1 Polyisoprenoid-binding protein YceI [Halopseudomonas xinjiangensis]
MKKTFAGIALGSLLALSGSLQAADYVIDKEGQHAFINFKISHLGYSWLYGRFNDFDGTFSWDADKPAESDVQVTIQTASVDSNHAERDKHLRSDDFLSVEEHPEATFKSTDVEMTGENTAKITGDLTLNGVTKPVVLDAKFLGEGKDPWGGYRAGFEGSTTLKLKDFDITKNLGPASEEVELILSVEGVRQ